MDAAAQAATLRHGAFEDAQALFAGKVQMMIDGTVVLLALCVVPVERVAYSVLAVLVMSGFLWLSHRPGRYTGG